MNMSSKDMLKKECAFLNILAHNDHKKQMQKFLQYLITPSQYTLLRELVVNELARNLPIRKKKPLLGKSLKLNYSAWLTGNLKNKTCTFYIQFLNYWL